MDSEKEVWPGRWLGVSHQVSSSLCYFILTEHAGVISCTTVQHISKHELADPNVQDRLRRFDETVEERLNDENFFSPDEHLVSSNNIFGWDTPTFELNSLFDKFFGDPDFEESTNDNDNYLPDHEEGTNSSKGGDNPIPAANSDDYNNESYGSLLSA